MLFRISCRLATVAALLGSGPAMAEPFRYWSNWAPFGIEQPKWDRQYLALSTGFEVVSHGRGRTYAGPTLGIEAGKMWHEGDFVYGVAADVNYMKSFTAGGASNSSLMEVTRDFAGSARFKFGYLAAPNFLLYSTVGVSALNETWRYPTIAGGGSDQRFAIRPEVGAGFEWAINDRTRLWMELRAAPPTR